MEKIKKNILLILVILLAWPAVKDLFSPGFFPMHDDTQPARVFVMAKALKDGQFPVRWVSDLGYGFGYPLYNFYAPLPYYFGAVFVLLGMDVIWATKIMIGFGFILSGLTMFYLSKRLWGNYGAIISSILYVYAPYHAVQLYVRGAVGELWAYGFLPLVILGLIQLKERFRLGVIIGSLGLAGVVLSHNISGLILAYLLGLVILNSLGKSIYKNDSFKITLNRLFLCGLGLGLSAFFWLPAIFEARFTRVNILVSGTSDFRQHFVYFDQLWNSPWGFAGSAPGRVDGMSFVIGKIHLLLGLIVILRFIFKRIPGIKTIIGKIMIDLFYGLVFTVYLILPYSKYLWGFLPYFPFIQYPWRLLTFSLFFLSTLGGALILNMTINNFRKKIAVLVLGVLIILVNLKYFHPQYLNSKTSQDYISETAMRWDISRISDEYMPKYFPVPASFSQEANKSYSAANDIIVERQEIKTQLINLNISVSQMTEIVFSIADFPGWRMVIDGTKAEKGLSNGLISAVLPAGRHIITVYFQDTWVRKLGNLISVVSIIYLIYLLRAYKIES